MPGAAIDFKTKVELYAVAACAVVAAGILWRAAMVSSDADAANRKNIEQDLVLKETRVLIDFNQAIVLKELYEIKGSVIRMETKLEKKEK